ncbi:MAG: hypothetical protein KGI84_08040, partial [Elusimicrobia bacterium]|nr:hypothetical protein [Elusimicrobiota bacterium]
MSGIIRGARIRRRFSFGAFWVIAASAFSVSSICFAGEPIFNEFAEHFKQPYFDVGALVQAGGDWQSQPSSPSGNNGFSLATARIILQGKLDEGFSYFFQNDFTKTPAILDAIASWTADPRLTIRGGRFKSPFSAEFLIWGGNLDFINRAQVVNELAPGRQVGVQASGEFLESKLSYAIGAFNGNSSGSNDNNQMMSVGRLGFAPFNEGSRWGKLQVGISGAYSDDARAQLGTILPNFAGTRRLAGGDFRWTKGRLLLSSEAIASSISRNMLMHLNRMNFVKMIVNATETHIPGLSRFSADSGRVP